MVRTALYSLAALVIGALLATIAFSGHSSAATRPGQLASPSANDIAVATAPHNAVEPAPDYAGTSVSYGDPATVASSLLSDPRGVAMIEVSRSGLTPAHQAATDLQIVTLGVTVCQAFDRNVSFTTLVNIGQQNGYSPGEASTMIGAAVGSMCREHVDAIR